MADEMTYFSADEGEAAPESPSKKKEGDADSALVPKSIFGGKVPEVGETISMKVLHDYEDHLEMQLAGKSKTDGSEDESADAAIDRAAMLRGKGAMGEGMMG